MKLFIGILFAFISCVVYTSLPFSGIITYADEPKVDYRKQKKDSWENSEIEPVVFWDPLDPVEPLRFQFKSYGVLILNREITLDSLTVEKLWNQASYRIIVDGGIDRWFNYLKNNKMNIVNKFPDLISGDFDSIDKKTLEYCRKNGVIIEKTYDQKYTDFQKSLKFFVERSKEPISSIAVLCHTCGRIDHIFQNYNTLGKTSSLTGIPTFPPIFMISHETMTWFLKKGTHTIKIPQYLIDNQLWCAILPYEPMKNNSITTTGLKWNLGKHNGEIVKDLTVNSSIEFGGLISSSNTYSNASEVTIKTNVNIIWSMGISKET